MKKLLLVLSCVMSLTYICRAQNKEIDFELKKTGMFTDDYKLSEALEAVSDGKGGVFFARSFASYFGKKQGYLLEHYDSKMAKIKSYKHEMEDGDQLLGVLFDKSTVNFIEYTYDNKQGAYICYANRGDVKDMKLTKKELFRLNIKEVKGYIFGANPYEAHLEDLYPFKFSANKNKTAFGILVNINAAKVEEAAHDVYVFNNNLDLVVKNTLQKEFKKDAYIAKVFEITEDGSVAYILGKVKAGKTKNKGASEYYYDITKITSGDTKVLAIDNHNYDESLKMILKKGEVICVGFYSGVKEWQPEGLHYISINAGSMEVLNNKLTPFSEELKLSSGYKFDKEIGAYSIRNLMLTSNENIIFSAEQDEKDQHFIGNNLNVNVPIELYRDIMSVSLNSKGEIVWAKFINKHQNTSGAARDYLSFTAMTLNDDVYYFINGILKFKDGSFRIAYRGLDNADFNVVKIDKDGNVKAQKLIDISDVKVPFRATEGVLVPNTGNIFFLGREYKDKQLISVSL